MSDRLQQDIAILDRMEALLATPERWTREVYYTLTDGRGNMNAITLPEEKIGSFCLMGSAAYAYTEQGHGDISCFTEAIERIVAHGDLIDALEQATDTHTTEDLFTFNDNPKTTHADILGVIRRARALLQARTAA